MRVNDVPQTTVNGKKGQYSLLMTWTEVITSEIMRLYVPITSPFFLEIPRYSTDTSAAPPGPSKRSSTMISPTSSSTAKPAINVDPA